MDSNEPNQTSFFGPHLPLTLISGAAIMFFASQLSSISQGSENMKWQQSNAEKALKNLTEAKATLIKNVDGDERKALVAQSQQLQKQFSDLMKELDELRRSGDKDAELIIKGYGIQVNDPTPSTGGAPAATPPAEPKKDDKPAAPQ
jgi:hypothetical protein